MSAEIYIDSQLEKYIDDILAATHHARHVRRGPPADLHTQILDAAKAHARQEPRRYVVPADIKLAAAELLRASIIWDDAVVPDQVDAVIRALIDAVCVP